MSQKRKRHADFTDTKYKDNHGSLADMEICWNCIERESLKELRDAVAEALKPCMVGNPTATLDQDSPYLSSDDPLFEEMAGTDVSAQTSHHPFLGKKPFIYDPANLNNGWCLED